jgi:alkylation response protein AidB-like acyl-CoA dehydrogenase
MAPEAAGGLGLGLTDALAVATETGRAQTPFPVIETIAAASLLSRARPDALAEILNGAALATCATGGAATIGAGKAPRLRGTVTVPFADRARWLAVPVNRQDRNDPGPWAAIVDLEAPGVAISPAPALDLTYPLFRVELDAAIEGGDVIEHELQPMLAVLAAAELTGAAEHCLDLTVKYLKERVQFGKTIGTNQALRHTAADDWVRVQGMRAVSEYAAAAFDAAQSGSGTPQAFRHAAHVAKAYCSQAAREVAEHAIHLHGGIGFTWEFGLHVPLRRILRLASSFGTAADHCDALAADLLRRDKGNGTG